MKIIHKVKINEKHLKDVTSYRAKVYYEKERNCYISVKRIESIEEPFSISFDGGRLCLVDDGYYLLEIIPLDENYAFRIFFDENKEIIEYYFDISESNGFENGSPYYYDMILDIRIVKDRDIEVLDEDELKESLELGGINKEQYETAYKIMNDLLSELKEEKNIFMNDDHKMYLSDI